MATIDLFCRDAVKAEWRTSETYACASFTTDDGIINLFASIEQRERMKRAVEAFAAEMQREPVAQQQAAE